MNSGLTSSCDSTSAALDAWFRVMARLHRRSSGWIGTVAVDLGDTFKRYLI